MVLCVLVIVNGGLKGIVVLALALLNAEYDVTIHLDKAAVAIPCKALVFCGLGQRDNSFVVETEVQNRIHHTRHRITGA